jgi:hypothetical protein
MEIQNDAFPVLNLQRLLRLPKGRKAQDMQRIMYSKYDEDWVTSNFFQVKSGQYPDAWWGHFISAARRRNADLTLAADDRSLPTLRFWSSVPSPAEYESQSRGRVLKSGNTEWESRAKVAEPVEGPSEIDIMFDHDQFLFYVEAKPGADVSMSTTYDPQRNQLIRNIDCLIASAGSRQPIFWLLVRDEAPARA